MKLLSNSGMERVVDELRSSITAKAALDATTPAFSLFAFSVLREAFANLEECRLILPPIDQVGTRFLGSDADRPYRNQLQTRWIARQLSDWITAKAELRVAKGGVPQSLFVIREAGTTLQKAITGAFPFTTDGLGLTPGVQASLIQCSESAAEGAMYGDWFLNQWNALPPNAEAKTALLSHLQELVEHKSPSTAYFKILFQLFSDLGEELDEERVVKSATGIRQTAVWQKLYKFQKDGVIGAIDKLERFGGCIIADSVGLGKTFEALAIIKYYELRNDRVLVLAPKRLRDNWTLYKTNDVRNVLTTDRLNYDVLNHTDLSRSGGSSGDINLATINWGNYDLVVIDESHNFRNKSAHNERETRYDRLMKWVIKTGVKTKVLMLSATPVNSRLTDLKNQIAFVTEGEDGALAGNGIPSIEATIRQAQLQFNRWLSLEESDRKPGRLLEMLGFDYFKLLDLLTIARSRKHIEKYYGITETGKFPDRLRPINIKPDVDCSREFRPIQEINDEIRRLNLSAYAPLHYILPHKLAKYEATYSTEVKGGTSIFKQADREESLIHLMRVNILKRMESSVTSFALTLERQLADVDELLKRIDSCSETLEEPVIDDIDVDDPDFESLLVGRKVKVLLNDVDRVRWRQDLQEDRNRLATLLSAARQIEPQRDAKLEALRDVIRHKCEQPLNPGNRKVIVFTHFADTATYLYDQLAPWAKATLNLHSALVTGGGHIKTTLPGLRADMGHILTAFSPVSKERDEKYASEGEIDLLIATDCISEGQNLQDCDYLVNFDIHWNPVRIIQRFGRIDRIGSKNTSVQLVNFWPNIELEEYINLEQRVRGRMVLLDISATGEENLLDSQSEDQIKRQMNDLEYRRKQLLKLQDAVIDLEDLSSGVSIADLTLNDFRIDLSNFRREYPGRVEGLPEGLFAVTTTHGNGNGEPEIPPGIIFCLRASSETALASIEPGYPLAPFYLVHIGEDGTILVPFTQAKRILDRLKRLTIGRDLPDALATARFDRATKMGENMATAQKLLATAVSSIVGKKEERSLASLFTPGGTHALKGEFQGINDFEVVAYLVVLSETETGKA